MSAGDINAAPLMSAQMVAQMDDDRDWFAANQSRRFRLRMPHHKELAGHAKATDSEMTDAMSRAVVLVANTPLACRFSYPVHLWWGASQVDRCNTEAICALIWKGVQGTATPADGREFHQLLIEAGVVQ